MRAKFYFILIFNFIFDVYIFGGLGWPHCATFVFSWTSSTPWHNKHFYDTCTQMKNSMFHPYRQRQVIEQVAAVQHANEATTISVQ